MTQINHIDDYIEPQLIIQAKAHEIEGLTRSKDYKAAYNASMELVVAATALQAWLWKNMDGQKNG